MHSPPGKACQVDGADSDAVVEECRAGYYCRLGAPSPTPTDVSCVDDEKTACLPGAKCPKGYFCPEGSSTPVGCPLGTTGSTEGAIDNNACSPCPANFFCPPGGDDSGLDTKCPKGNVCPEGSAEATKCPAGTFNRVQGLQEESQCSLCPPGKFCGSEGLEEPSGACAAGFYCQAGATTQQHDAQNWPEGSGKCPPGHYCPAGMVSTAKKVPLRPPQFRKRRETSAPKAITVQKVDRLIDDSKML
ncbi:uncharacterized protein EMH_0045700 [Eimeria mitis]|uniref:Cytadherence high molecular weight protein 2, related n=1 Tax=Eimeria mitis TaxID=44415 RepID=U6KGP1_9EIME|nr:uncharacterized protein EMH_0045700 [Eimeria mitis]CDJ35941.1 hypothetical protein, conserved [Eimeria mitis]